MFKKIGYLVLSIIIMASLVLGGVSCGTKGTKQNNTPRPPPRTGNITTGTKVDAVSQSIDATGGMISVSKPGDPLDGFVLDIPANSYTTSNNFKVSYAPITNQTFGPDITPISPLITIDNGGVVADKMIYMRIPAQVPEGYFAMGFIYDAKTRQLEGLPLIAADADSLTIGTNHFCDLFLGMIDKALLKNDIDSGFKPGVDDWQFANFGSFIAPGGHCTGQAMSAMWYYCTQPDGSNAHLYGRYDNNGQKPPTPDLWQDDSLGYRFASVVHKGAESWVRTFWQNMAGKKWIKENNVVKMVDAPLGLSDETAWYLFAYSMQATGEPQLVAIWSKDGAGHAMVAYRIKDGQIYVADPNYPGNTERRIEYTSGKFNPYDSGANADEIAKGNGQAYEKIMYYAKTTLNSWDTIASNWAQLKNKTIGNDKFPDSQLYYQNDKAAWVPLTDGLKTNFDAISIDSYQGWTIEVYRDGQLLQSDDKKNYDLNPGNNKLGIAIYGKVDSNWKYVDFKYVNVIYEAETTPVTTPTKTSDNGYPVITSFTGPTDISQVKDPSATVQFSVKITGGRPPYKETWYANMQQIFQGTKLETVEVPVSRLRYNGDSWSIYLMVEDADGKPAQWIDSSNMTHPEFVYGITRAGQVIVEPSIPYRAFGAK